MKRKHVDDDEILGRGVFSSTYSNGKKKLSFFTRELASCLGTMSVDRLTHADKSTLCRVHDDDAAKRGQGRQFYGWYTFETSVARDIGLDAVPSPSTDSRNIWHANLIVPEGDDSLPVFANKLSAASEWRFRPLGPQVVMDIEGTG